MTYEGMASYWPTPAAVEDDPLVADFMNSVPKIVYSATLDTADWQNTTLVKGDAVESVGELKQQSGKELALFGSPHLTVSLLEHGLVDELRVMVNPILLGGGKSLFTGLTDRVRLQLQTSTTFSSGNVLLCYRPELPGRRTDGGIPAAVRVPRVLVRASTGPPASPLPSTSDPPIT